MKSPIEKRLTDLKASILGACQKSGRSPGEIQIVAVSKKKPISDIVTALDLGLIDFAENYVQDFLGKYSELKNHPVRWHFVGHIQRNKAKKIVGRIHLIHTLDRLPLAQTLNELCQEMNCTQDCLIQVKVSAEESKHGCAIADLFPLVQELNALPHLTVKGLMTIGTLTNDSHQTRAEFRILKNLRDRINRDHLYRSPLTELSMGMSNDYILAIEEGATMIRVGTALFGERT